MARRGDEPSQLTGRILATGLIVMSAVFALVGFVLGTRDVSEGVALLVGLGMFVIALFVTLPPILRRRAGGPSRFWGRRGGPAP